MTIASQDLAVLRSLANRGDKVAAVLVRAFDTTRAADKELILVRCATTAQNAMNGIVSTCDGKTLVAGDLVLVKVQDDASENGIYVAVAGAAWHRLKDDQGDDVLRPGMVVQVREGSVAADTMWTCTSDATVVGTDDIVFAQLTTALAASSISPRLINGGSYFAYEQDFPLAAGGTLPPPLAKDINLTGSGDYLDDSVGGVYSLATAAVSEAQDAQLTFGNQLIVNPAAGPIFEARVRVNIPGATITADERWVVGLCSNHTNSEDALDSVVSNVWFRGEGANLNIFIEGDDGTTDTDDTDSTIDYVDNTWMLLKIDMTTLSAIKFYIDGVLVGTTVSAPLLSVSTPLQPIFCYQRDAGTEINLLQIDWFKITQGRV